MKKLLIIVCLAIVFVGTIAFSGSSSRYIDINKLYLEIQRMDRGIDMVKFVCWLPEEYWITGFTGGRLGDGNIPWFADKIKLYVIVSVAEGKAKQGGSIDYSTEESIRKNLYIKDKHGDYYRPLIEERIDSGVKAILKTFKPRIAKSMGPAGQNMHFFVFLNKNQKGETIADVKESGVFWIRLGTKEFKWKLPLSSVLPPIICSNLKCKEECSGVWNYCPWCGTKLRK